MFHNNRHLKIIQMWTTGDLQRKISSIPYRNAGKRIEHFHIFKADQPGDLLDYLNYCAYYWLTFALFLARACCERNPY